MTLIESDSLSVIFAVQNTLTTVLYSLRMGSVTTINFSVVTVLTVDISNVVVAFVIAVVQVESLISDWSTRICCWYSPLCAHELCRQGVEQQLGRVFRVKHHLIIIKHSVIFNTKDFTNKQRFKLLRGSLPWGKRVGK